MTVLPFLDPGVPTATCGRLRLSIDTLGPLSGKSSSGVSARTSLLVAGEKAGSKRAKAEAWGVRIITSEEFATLVGDVR